MTPKECLASIRVAVQQIEVMADAPVFDDFAEELDALERAAWQLAEAIVEAQVESDPGADGF